MSKSATELLNDLVVPEDIQRENEYKTKLKNIETTAYLLKDKASKLSHGSLSDDQKERGLAFLLCRNVEIFNMLQELLWIDEREKNNIQQTELPIDYSRNLFTINGNIQTGFEIKGPIIPKKTKLFQNEQARFLSNSLRITVKKYLEKNKINTPVYSKANVIFTLNFPKSFPELSLPDADNLETKGFLDALGMLLIENDGMTSISYTMRLNRKDTVFEPYTSMQVIPI